MSEERLDRIERAIESLTAASLRHETENRAILERMETEVRRWDERFFQLSRDNLNVSRTIIIVAGSAVIFSPLFQSLSPLIQKLVTQVIQGSPAG